MLTVLHSLRTQLDKPPFGDRTFRVLGAAVFGGGILFAWIVAGLAWWDYLSAQPVEDTVLSIREYPDREYPIHIVEFNERNYPLMFVGSDRTPGKLAWAWMAGALNADDAEVKALEVQDRVTLWVSPRTGRATPAPRIPLALTAVALLLTPFFRPLVQPRRRSSDALHIDRCFDAGRVVPPQGLAEQRTKSADGTVKVALRPAPRNTLPVLQILGIGLYAPLMAWAFIATMAIGAAVWFSYPDHELVARTMLPPVMMMLVLMPLMAVSTIVLPRRDNAVTWDESAIRIGGWTFKRFEIDRIALIPIGTHAVLQILEKGKDWAVWPPGDAIWLASVLEGLGYEIEFSPTSISTPNWPWRRRRLRATSDGRPR